MFTLLSRFSKYSIVILSFLAITLSHAQEDRAEDISILDVDANGEVDALTDGLLLLRSMFELTDDALVTGVVDSTNCKECDAEGIDSYITSIKGTTYGGLDNQNISGSNLSGTTLTIGIENGANETVDLSSLEDGTGITSAQASAITDNTAKVGITSAQASAITDNTAKVGITSAQASAITDNTAKVGITSAQASAITDNTAKVGITSGQASAITANTAKVVITQVNGLSDALVEDDSIYIGSDPSATTSDAQHNVAIGPNALIAITTGDANIAVGFSLTSNTEGSVNTSVGYGALKENLTGNYNSGYGRGALIENTSGTGNTANGWNALSVNKTGNYNTAVGAMADLGADNLTNATAIGNGAIVTASNTMQLGNTSVTNVKTSGSVTAGAITIPNTDGSNGQLLATDGSGQLYWLTLVPLTEAQASAITANTAKTGITSSQASAITANTAKTGITSSQASAITANTAKVGMTLGTTSTTALAGNTTTITSGQASAITANTAKVGMTLGTTSSTALAGDTAYSTLALGTTSTTALAGNALSGTVNIGQTGATTTVLGTLNVDEAVTLDTTLSVTGVSTFSGATALNGDVQIGNNASDRIGFFGGTPIERDNVLSLASTTCGAPSGIGCYANVVENRDKINELIQKLQELGLIN